MKKLLCLCDKQSLLSSEVGPAEFFLSMSDRESESLVFLMAARHWREPI